MPKTNASTSGTGGTAGGLAGLGLAGLGTVAADAAGEAAFQAQIATLTAASLKASERSVMLRAVNLELSAIKKVADERVQ